MKYPLSLSVVVVQTAENKRPTAYVTVWEADSTEQVSNVVVRLDDMDGATDSTMWAQMAAARVCDVL